MTHPNAPKALTAVTVVIAVLFALVATAGLIFQLLIGGVKWLYVSVALLLCLKAILAFLIFLHTRSVIRSTAVLLTKEWKTLAIGWVLVAALFLVSGLTGEGLVGFFGAPVYLTVAIVFWFKGAVKKDDKVAVY